MSLIGASLSTNPESLNARKRLSTNGFPVSQDLGFHQRKVDTISMSAMLVLGCANSTLVLEFKNMELIPMLGTQGSNCSKVKPLGRHNLIYRGPLAYSRWWYVHLALWYLA